MPLDDDRRWENYRHLIMPASDAVHHAIVDLPIWAQYCVLGSNLETILKPMSEKQRALDVTTFVRNLLNHINHDDEGEDNTCPAS